MTGRRVPSCSSSASLGCHFRGQPLAAGVAEGVLRALWRSSGSIAADARRADGNVIDEDAGLAALHAHAAEEQLGVGGLNGPAPLPVDDGRGLDTVDPERGGLR